MADFAFVLLDWYEGNRRRLPWREESSPYRTLVSEIMLQQTRVETVVPYFERFMARFPSFEALSAANEEEVLRFWQGLGYYSRARNLHKAAEIVVREYHGALPSDVTLLKRLPGVGDYVSHAVASIGFDLPFVSVDGNLIRVYSRLEALAVSPDDPKAKKDCEAYFSKRLSSPSRFNQALMDLGELVCLPHGEPRCGSCPFARRCKAHRVGNETAFPLAKRKVAALVEPITVLLVFDDEGRVAVRKRAGTGLLAAMHEFPNLPSHQSVETIAEAFPFLSNISACGKAKHRFSHVVWDMAVFKAEGILPDATYVPLSEIKTRCSLPTAFSKILGLLDKE